VRLWRSRNVTLGGAKRRSLRSFSSFLLLYLRYLSHCNCSRRSFSHAASLKCFAAHWDQCRR